MPTIIPLTPEATWLASLGALPAWQPPRVPTLVLAPHPDDETLGTGGLIAQLREHGVPVHVAAVTDGENAYAGERELALQRVPEQVEALARLGVPSASIHRLGLPDRDVSLHEDRLVAQLRELAAPGMHLLAPWPGDFHPDHEATGRAAARVAAEQNLRLTFYVFWAWHRGTPATFAGHRLVRLELSAGQQQRREHAIQAHPSQLHHADGQPILSDTLLAPARRSFEVYLPQ